VDEIATAVTLFDDDIRNEEQLVAALHAGRFRVEKRVQKTVVR